MIELCCFYSFNMRYICQGKCDINSLRSFAIYTRFTRKRYDINPRSRSEHIACLHISHASAYIVNPLRIYIAVAKPHKLQFVNKKRTLTINS